MLRAVTRQQVSDIVENSYFGAENYSIEYGDIRSMTAFKVKFLADSRFLFELKRNGSAEIEPISPRSLGSIDLFFQELEPQKDFKSLEAPGEKFLATEQFVFSGFDTGIERLRSWLDRVHQEVIESNPFTKEIYEIKAQLDAKLAALGEESASFFTKAEAQDLIDRLSAFETRLSSISDENEELKSAVHVLSRTVADLKEAANSVNRASA